MARATGFTWSYSKLGVFETCPAKYKYKFLDKLPDPPGPAMERGNEIHAKAAKYFIEPRSRLAPELAKLRDYFEDLRRPVRKERDKGGAPAHAELRWGITRDWTLTEYFGSDVWLRVVLDLYKLERPTHARIIDWKTGRIYDDGGYESQLELYGVGALSVVNELETVSTALAFIDQGKIVGDTPKETFHRKDLEKLQARWTKRVGKVEVSKKFLPNPNSTCKFCPYQKQRGGPCKY